MKKEILKSIIEVKDPTINSIVGIAGTTVTCLFGKWDNIIQILALLILLDYVTGITKGYLNKELASGVGFRGLLKKGAIFIVIILAHQIDLASNTSTPIFRTMSIYFYIGNEGLSLSENLVALGVPLPGFLTNALKTMQEKNNNLPKDGELNE